MGRKRAVMAESELQRELVRLARMMGLFVFSVPNEGRRSPGVAGKMKSMGLSSGVPDLVFALSSGRVVFLELKTEVGALSREQKSRQRELESRGHDVRVAYGLEEGLRAVQEIARMDREVSGR